MNFSWLDPLLVEKAKDGSLLGAIEHPANVERKAFSAKKGAVFRHGA
jgi:hypothetical protein